MQFNYKKSNAAELGKTFSKQSGDFYVTNRENSPDFTMLAETAMQARSAERQTARALEGKLASKGLELTAEVGFQKIKADTEKKVRDIKKPANRMAGIVGLAGTLAGYGVLNAQEQKQQEIEDRRAAEMRGLRDEISQAYSKFTNAPAPTPIPDPPKYQKPDLKGGQTGSTPKPAGSGDDSASGTDDNSGSDGGSASNGGTVSKAKPGKIWTQEEVKQGLIKRGMSPEEARIGSAVMMGESKGDSATDTVKSGLDPQKKNEFSVGLFQINTKAHMDKLTSRGLNIDSLRDGETNMDLAVAVYKEAGNSWKPWGAYTNGSYRSFLK